ncbi:MULTISPECIES: siderophore-interacting protein [Psychrobacter]|uniref:siderophore-interacting protein n=1 Tax=Psychrobacter TaxID=497 RepID=UPI0015F415E1|nr:MULTISPECIES: siderophore-interacting protein [Psychrobacter]MBA6243242.1 SIP domain-containing protein [Psychrobacter sp. Urea-trap-18]MBA6284909.1 SIP domain-containing protein [Psychrobacter sp. Urea-trap-16]MBA6317655.1 SIP domain-containing protein [Psychrobacter sp. Urea-trap-20]MBA6333574.1 SIP domain-containing protein [Psychrobacter sp. Urea-trap-19]
MTNLLLAPTENIDNQNSQYTPLNDPEIASVVAHINEEHLDELLGFLSAFTSLSTTELDLVDAQITDIYAEGIAIQTFLKSSEIQPAGAHNTSLDDQTFFIAFAAPISQLDDLQAQYILLKQRADKKLGKKTIKLTKQAFEVQNSYRVSKNMLRLELSMPSLSDTPLNNAAQLSNAKGAKNSTSVPTNEAGYAYLFDLEHNATTNALMTDSTDGNKANDYKTNGSDKENVHPARPHCYYTLRKAWQADDEIRAWVDVFLHGDTPGGNWAAALQAGETIVTKREFPEKVEHLRDGQAVLIVDETSMPTAARLLELWNNPTPPLVICVTQDAGDQSYFYTVKMRSGLDCETESRKDNHFTVLPIVTNQVNSGAELATLIDRELGDYLTNNPLKIDKVWGALEANTAKALRPLLKDRLDLSRTDVVVKVYWRHD